MKQIILLFFAVSCWMVGCSSVKVTDEQLVGSYTFEIKENIEEDSETPEMYIRFSGTSIYNSDNTFTSNGTISIGVDVDEDGYRNYIILFYDLSMSGHWQLVDGNKLVEQCDNYVSINYSDTKLKNNDEQGEMVSMYMVEMMDDQIEAMKDELANKTTSDILSFDKTKMVVKESDGGTKTEYIRN